MAYAEPSNIETLTQLLEYPNIVEALDDQELGRIAHRVMDEYNIDLESRSEWEERIEYAMELAMLVAKEKDFPFEGAANVKFPLLTTAALQFNARAYPAIIPGTRVVKCLTHGDDKAGKKAARGDRVSEHMSHQLISEQPEWEEDTDRLLVALPILGCMFRKVYRDVSLGRNRTSMITPDNLVVNYNARSLEDAPRITEKVHLYPYEIQERIKSRRFIEFEYGTARQEEDGETTRDDPDAPHLFLEQHRLLDLDGDGYPEPYIVTVHEQSHKVCRIVANFTPQSIVLSEQNEIQSIRRQHFYVKYQFLPAPDGGFYGWGFGWLLKDIGESINTTIDQMLDAATLQNANGGGLVSSSLGIREKTIRLELGEFRTINTGGMPMNQAIWQPNYPGPSTVLFSLLGMLIEAGKDISATKDILTGDTGGKVIQPTTMMAMIEQGLQVFTAIFKRVHRALKAELKLHANLNQQFVTPEEYNSFFDEVNEETGQPVMYDPREDYMMADRDIEPISDPKMATRMQELTKADFLRTYAAENPAIDQVEATMRVLEAAQIEDSDQLLATPDPEQILVTKLATELDLEFKEAEVMAKMAKGIRDIAEAEGVEPGQQMDRYGLILKALGMELKADNDRQRAVPGMAGQPGNAVGNGSTAAGG